MLGTSSNVTYLTIKEGKIALKKDGNVELHDNVTGKLTDISVKEDGKYGAEIHLTIVGDKTYKLQMKLDSGNGCSFMKAVPNADLSKPIEFSPWFKIIDNKKKSALYLNQDVTIPWFFTRETPNGMPDPVKIRKGGKDEWDYYDQVAFLKDYLLTKVKPKLSKTPIHVDEINSNHDDSESPF